MKLLTHLILATSVLFLISACSSDDTTAASFPFTNGDGIAELTGPPVLNPASVSVGTTPITVDIPVDSDTEFMIVSVGNGIADVNGVDAPLMTASTHTETVNVPIVTALTAGGTYYVTLIACTSAQTFTCANTGIIYTESSTVAGTYQKGDLSGSLSLVETGVAIQYLTVTP